MHDFQLNLPTTNHAVSLPFNDAAGCKAWLSQCSLVNVVQSHAEILNALAQLNHATLPALDRFNINELLREAIHFLQEELVKKFWHRAFPLQPQEQAIYNSTIALWHEITTAYSHCLQACLDKDPTIVELAPLICQRCLAYSMLEMRAYYLSYQELPPNSWLNLHQLYQISERGFAAREVKDELAPNQTSSCTAVYVKALLLRAANPNALMIRQLMLLDRLLDQWANQVNISFQPIVTLRENGLAVDLITDKGAAKITEIQFADSVRYLDTERLTQTIQQMIQLLQQGESPGQFGLGEDYLLPASEAFLHYLLQQWSSSGSKRALPRHTAEGQVEVCLGLSAIHYFIGANSAETDAKTSSPESELKTFGLGYPPARQAKPQAAPSFKLEKWDLINQSGFGFRLRRPDIEGERVNHNNLLAIRPSDTPHFLLGIIRWLVLTENTQIHLGIRILPGIPSAITAYYSDNGVTEKNKPLPLLLLPELATLQAEASVIIPTGCFEPGRTLELHHQNERSYIRLQSLVERGTNFERVSFFKVKRL